MNSKVMRKLTASGIAMGVIVLIASGIHLAPAFWRSAAATEAAKPPVSEPANATASELPKPVVPESAKPGAAEARPSGVDKKKSKKPVPKPVAAEPLTPEQATQRAADPKAPSGALIVKPPEGSPAPAASSPTPPAPSRP